ncbi:homoserine dehydrogenase [Formicincola oecophyllae]|uniref:Homoserine dehydrogenase n=1 Tax=Formicincola oecophyllae TaxID=2558361 RepID=A0A4Y6UAE3_9PROT|nr:homoserine dehydrogenase [Formicincola oecophyllae]QDH13407.1 homoserine dehydrogenase [Formicincola oecophyllae]
MTQADHTAPVEETTPDHSPSSALPPLRLGVAGLGTVGAGLLALLERCEGNLSRHCGRDVVVQAVSARSRGRDRGVSLEGVTWHDDPVALARDPEVDIVVELIGGSDGPARAVVENALRLGKPVVTANKALIARHGHELAALSQQYQAPVLYEAAVGGALPAVRLVRDTCSADEVLCVGGILNGTCNYILTEMANTGRSFADVLDEAQAKGYAEADPSTDIDGVDTAHKLAILAGLAFQPLDFTSIPVTGIRHVTTEDLRFAATLGYRVRLLGMARRGLGASTPPEAWVQPCLVPEDSALATVNGVYNAVTAEAHFAGPLVITGQGAGAGPTASAVASDIAALARNWPSRTHAFPLWGVHSQPASGRDVLGEGKAAGAENVTSRFYMRCEVDDRPGVMADVASILRDHGVSVHQVIQHEAALPNHVHMALVTHPANAEAVAQAAQRMAMLPCIHETPMVMKVEPS